MPDIAGLTKCLGWGAKRGKCMNFTSPNSSLCWGCRRRAGRESTKRIPYYDADGMTHAERVADGHLTEADANRLAGQAEDQGEDR